MWICAAALCVAQQIPHDDEVRIAEGFRLALRIEDKIWPGWSKAPFSVLLVTPDGEFLVNHPRQPDGFAKAGHSDLLNSDIYFRKRQFQLSFLATFPAVGDGIPVIVIGQPKNTEAKTSTPWVITFLHEHFHQLQYSQPDYQAAVAKLGLDRGDTSGMWMLNYPFPYESQEVKAAFESLKNSLLVALVQKNDFEFKQKKSGFLKARERLLQLLNDEDRRYFGFQLWQEGIARYTQVKAAEAAARYQPTDEYRKLSDYESFTDYAKRAAEDTERELRKADIAGWQRVVFYSYGACEGFFLDHSDRRWKRRYFEQKFNTNLYSKGTTDQPLTSRHSGMASHLLGRNTARGER